MGVEWYFAILTVATSQIFRLPITLISNGIPKHWFNWIWIFIVGFLFGLVPFPLSLPGAWLNGVLFAGVFGLFFGTIVALSNIKATANIFKWQYVEIVYGAAIGLIAWLLVKIRKKNASSSD